jgi:glutaredoxin
LLDRYNIKHQEIVLDEINPNDAMEFSNCIYGRNQRFVPFIFLRGQSVGGYGELVRMHENG